eukprot:6314319-Amphidinium_carterae.2
MRASGQLHHTESGRSRRRTTTNQMEEFTQVQSASGVTQLDQQSDHVMLKDAVIMPVEFTEIGSETHQQRVTGNVMVKINKYAASAVSETPQSDNVKMQFAVIGAVMNTRSGEQMVSHSSVSVAQTILGDAATASGQIVNACSCNVMILIAFTSHAFDIWLGVHSMARSGVIVAIGQDQTNCCGSEVGQKLI